jgi:ankyrin repeat protein
MGKNKFGDTFFHIAIRHGQLEFVKQVVQYIEKNIEVLFDDKTARRFPFDIRWHFYANSSKWHMN